MYLSDSAHVKFGVCIENELLQFYSTDNAHTSIVNRFRTYYEPYSGIRFDTSTVQRFNRTENWEFLVSSNFLCPLGSAQTPNYSSAELNSNLDRPKLKKVSLLIQTPNLIRRT